MSKLFIIGNGFDSAHKMPTSYEEFRKYIIGEYELSEESVKFSVSMEKILL